MASYSPPESDQEKGVLQVYHVGLQNKLLQDKIVGSCTDIFKGSHAGGCAQPSIIGWHHFTDNQADHKILAILRQFKYT